MAWQRKPRGLWMFLAMAPSLAAAEGLALVGLYRGPELGFVEFTTEGGRVKGLAAGGGACPFEEAQAIIEGELEGNVLVGAVQLCQVGASCGTKAYPVLAFLNPVDGSLWADVKLDPACASPALRGTRLSLAVATPEDQQEALPGQGSASLVAKKKLGTKKNLELHRAALLAGKRALDAGDFAAAAQQFEVAIGYHEGNWAASFGLGVAEFKRGNVKRAIASYERARELAREARQENADIHYNLACAHSRLRDRKAALASLRTAIKLGFALPEEMSADPDLNGLLRDDPEFKRLVHQAWTQKDKAGRKAEGKL